MEVAWKLIGFPDGGACAGLAWPTPAFRNRQVPSVSVALPLNWVDDAALLFVKRSADVQCGDEGLNG
jgi:hypothetical protein